jgi:hypothetical protein
MRSPAFGDTLRRWCARLRDTTPSQLLRKVSNSDIPFGPISGPVSKMRSHPRHAVLLAKVIFAESATAACDRNFPIFSQQLKLGCGADPGQRAGRCGSMKSGSRLRRHRIIEGIFANALDDYGVMTAILLVFPGMLCALQWMALRCEQRGY